MDRLKIEFEESHSAAKLQPKQNKSSLKSSRKRTSNPYQKSEAGAN